MSATPAALLERAAAGDQSAWDDLVRRFHPLVWRVARSHGLDSAAAADVTQTTWLRLVENLGRLREPERVSAWLVTTARREALRQVKAGARVVPVEDPGLDVATDPEDAPDHDLLVEDRDRVLHAAFGRLGSACRELLTVLNADPPLSYAEISEVLDRPVGSIGPTRARCLDKLRDLVPAGITWT